MKLPGRIGIVVSGGPAPGINGVISSAVMEAHRQGYETVGLMNGFRNISSGQNSFGQGGEPFIPLNPDIVSSIFNKGGSILGTSRVNPFATPDSHERFLRTLRENEIDKLIVIGGEGSAYVSYQVSRLAPDIKVVHVPKTIDNDLILPNQYPSFGFETARYVGTTIMNTLMTDAETCQRWFLVTSMGRNAGFLALGLGLASRATVTLIREEFEKIRPTTKQVAEILFNSIKKRHQQGKEFGVAVVAEGIIDALDPTDDELLNNCPRDELGRIRYSQIELGDVLLPPLRNLCHQNGIDIKINTKNIGYELRCHDPVSFDIEYTTFLGFGAVKLLHDGHTAVMVTRDFDKLGCQPLESMLTPEGIIQSRSVDLDSDQYRVARSFMVR